MQLAYLVNQYPKVSHAFIRREILALEAAGIAVARFSVRAPDQLVDDSDRAEAERTRVLLAGGVLGLLTATLVAACSRPLRFARALTAAWRLGRRSERGVLVHLAYLMEAAVLRRELAHRSVTHLHAHFGTNSTAVALLCHTLGGPRYSFTVHGPEEFDRPYALSLTDKIAQAHAVVAISQFGRSQLYRWARYTDWPKVHVVHCAVDDEWLKVSPPPIDADSRRLVCIGRLCEQKGQALLVQAAAQLAHTGERFELVLVGDGEMRADIEALIGKHRLDAHVKITGWADGAEIKQHLARARALVLPSFGEGLPVVLMEAFAMGRPAISTAIAGIPELVRHGENGWLIVPGDVDAVADAMRQVLAANVGDLERMGQAGRRAVETHHNATQEALKLAQIFAPTTAEAEADTGADRAEPPSGRAAGTQPRHRVASAKGVVR